MSAFRASRIERSRDFVVEAPMARAFRHFEPEGERAWAEGWDPVYLAPADGHAQRGMVFTTAHGGEATLWMMTRYEPQAGLVEYVRATPGSRIGTVLVQCMPLGAARTRVTVVYTLTALSEEGNRTLAELDEAAYAVYIDSWAEAIGRLSAPPASRPPAAA